jgi:two-component system LytT family sensor kinase
MRNVRERMEVLYGSDAVMEMESRPGRGTRITLEMPIVDTSSLEVLATPAGRAAAR